MEIQQYIISWLTYLDKRVLQMTCKYLRDALHMELGSDFKDGSLAVKQPVLQNGSLVAEQFIHRWKSEERKVDAEPPILYAAKMGYVDLVAWVLKGSREVARSYKDRLVELLLTHPHEGREYLRPLTTRNHAKVVALFVAAEEGSDALLEPPKKEEYLVPREIVPIDMPQPDPPDLALPGYPRSRRDALPEGTLASLRKRYAEGRPSVLFEGRTLCCRVDGTTLVPCARHTTDDLDVFRASGTEDGKVTWATIMHVTPAVAPLSYVLSDTHLEIVKRQVGETRPKDARVGYQMWFPVEASPNSVAPVGNTFESTFLVTMAVLSGSVSDFERVRTSMAYDASRDALLVAPAVASGSMDMLTVVLEAITGRMQRNILPGLF